eukprot:scaffold2156_cov115-Cylindrotheca_fusiformis.AAC.16
MMKTIPLHESQNVSSSSPALTIFLKKMMRSKNNQAAFEIVVDNPRNVSSAQTSYDSRRSARRRSSARWCDLKVEEEGTKRNSVSAPFLPRRRPSNEPPFQPQQRASLTLTLPLPSRNQLSPTPPMEMSTKISEYQDVPLVIEAKFAAASSPMCDGAPSLPIRLE